MPRTNRPSRTASPRECDRTRDRASISAAVLFALAGTSAHAHAARDTTTEPAPRVEPSPRADSAPRAESAPRSAAAPVDRSAQHARPAVAANPAHSTAAHSTPPSNPDPTLRLVPVEAGIEDVSPLAVGLRTVPIDLRAPLDYDRVYRVQGDLSRFGLMSAGAPDAAWYARASGGTLALFPRSEYVPTRRGAMPVVPANTTFLMGVPSVVTTIAAPGGVNASAPHWNATPATRRADGPPRPYASPPSAREGAPLVMQAVSPTPARTHTATANAASSPAALPEPDTIWTSEGLRASRLSALLARVRASRAPDTSRALGADAAPTSPSAPGPASAPAPPASPPPITPASGP